MVSADNGASYDDLKNLTRRLMARVEQALSTQPEWVAIDHYNTGHFYASIPIRGRNDIGKDLIIAPECVSQGAFAIPCLCHPRIAIWLRSGLTAPSRIFWQYKAAFVAQTRTAGKN